MKKRPYFTLLTLLVLSGLGLSSCGGDSTNEPGVSDFTDLLTNQIDEVILPTMVAYQQEVSNLAAEIESLAAPVGDEGLSSLRQAYQEANLAYQRAAVHDYFSTASLDLVALTNLYPIEVSTLENLILAGSNRFSSLDHQRANGFPAIDYMLYGPSDVQSYLDNNRLVFLQEMVGDMKDRADNLASNWARIRDNFVAADGTSLGSAISGQLNGSLSYYEFTVREDKVGIPIGKLGPNDSPIPPDVTKIEAYYQSLFDGSDQFAKQLIRAAVEEMEEIYLGTTASGANGQGYDDLLQVRGQAAVDADIKAAFQAIYDELEVRAAITASDTKLYDAVQQVVTYYKSDMLPILNVQDADGANDGD